MRARLKLIAVLAMVSAGSATARTQSPAPVGPRERPVLELHHAIAPEEVRTLTVGTVARDTAAARIGNRRLHIVIGAGIGFAAGFILGKSVDGGRAGCNKEGSGLTCDWLSGYEEIIGGLAGAALGGTIGALLPHD